MTGAYSKTRTHTERWWEENTDLVDTQLPDYIYEECGRGDSIGQPPLTAAPLTIDVLSGAI